MKYVLRNHVIFENCLQTMRECMNYDHLYQVEIKRYNNQRTVDQNKLMWEFHNQFVAWMFLHKRVDVDPVVWHYKIFVGHFTGWKGEVIRPDGEIELIPYGSSELGVGDFIKALEKYEAWKLEQTGVGFEREQDT